jgi:DNA-directed RNA polymerase II subunit RPB1
MLVPPLLIRPSTTLADGSRVRGVDDLTVKLGEIVKANHQAKLVLARESNALLEKGLSLASQQAVSELSFHVNAFFINDGRASQQTSFQRSGLPFRSITSRLKGKEGRIRGTMVGKRVNFSARTVVSPDPVIDADEIGVPECMAAVLTVPELVTSQSLQDLQRRVRIGPGSNEGAVSIRKGLAKELVLLTYADRFQAAETLQFGDLVERPLQNGDIVLFNRQPSLHRGSILGQRVRLMPHLTFGVNLISSPSTNMDCDGDEMNLHVLQSPEAQLEARVLMLLPYQIVSPQSNKPCMGLVQDGILGLFLLSDPACTLTSQLFWSLLGTLKYANNLERPSGELTTHRGLDILALLFPRSLNYARKNLQGESVVIFDGRLLCGRLDKSVLGTSSNSLTQHLWLFWGPTRCMRFLSDGQRLACHYLQHVGFSISLSDCCLKAADHDNIRVLVKQAEARAAELQARSSHKLLEGQERRRQETEAAVAQVANTVLTDVGQFVAARLPKTNMLSQTVACGSKGNLINVAQIMGCVGQQVLEGKRIHGIELDQRPLLPLPPKLGLLETHGFINRSYLKGLKESQFFFHAMAGREGLIDTSVKTANTGYLQRRLMRALETLQVHEDLSVRNARGDIIQPCYGADGFDAAFLMKTTLSCLQDDLRDDVLMGTAPDCSEEEQAALAESLRSVLQFRAYRWTPDISSEVVSPLHLDQAVSEVRRAQQADSPRAKRPRTSFEAQLQKLLQRLVGLQAGQCLVQTLQLRWLLRSRRKLLFEPELCTADALRSLEDWSLLGDILQKQVLQAQARAGEMVGAIAAQSIGSDATQMTLNVFHHAGVASKDVTLGIHRLKELTDCVKVPRMPIMKMPLRKPEQSDLKVLLCLGDFLQQEPCVCSSLEDLDPEAFEALEFEMRWREIFCSENRHPSPTYAPWILQFFFDPQKMIESGYLPEHLATQVLNAQGGASRLTVAYAQPEMSRWFLVLRGDASSAAPAPPSEPYFISNQCQQIALQGTPKIRRSRFAKQALFFWQGGNLVFVPEMPMQITEGSCLRAAFLDPSCHQEHVRCNDVVETYQVLGIEAAAAVLFDELLLCIQFDGSYINARHVELLVNRMTCLGHLLPISRHGLNRLSDSGVLARCSFEETCDQLLEAAAYAETDALLGVTESVCLGQLSHIGSSFKGNGRWLQEVRRRLEFEQRREVPLTPAEGASLVLDAVVLSEAPREEPETPRSWQQEEGPNALAASGMPFPSADGLPSAGAQIWGALSDNPVHLSKTAEPEDGSFRPSSPRLFVRRASMSQQL